MKVPAGWKLVPINPYADDDSLAEQWDRGYGGQDDRKAVRGSAAERAWLEGRLAAHAVPPVDAGTTNQDEISVEIPRGLAALANGRDHITTSEFAGALNLADQTVRKNYSMTGACYGIHPIKSGKFLLWPVADIAALLGRGIAVPPDDIEDEHSEEDRREFESMFTSRTFHCLKGAGILTFRRLKITSRNELLKIPNFGSKSYKEVRIALDKKFPDPE